jgi:Ser/Thr protein kinase RdoA (MazF antagonist)
MKEIINKFNFKGVIISVDENTTGLINSTFIISSDSEKYVLQKINTLIFNNPEKLMCNIETVTHFLNVIGKSTLEIIKSKDGNLFVEFNGSYWRAFKYIESKTYLKTDNFRIVKECGKCLANFHKDLHQFPVENFNFTISSFHNQELIFSDFQTVFLNAPKSITEQCAEQINYILKNEEDFKLIQKLISENKIPLRVCHNDPKISNFLFTDKKSAICLIDLDTVMPGTILTDIADAIRTICVSESEEETDLKKVYFRYDYFELFIVSYLNVNGHNLNKYELQNIIKSIELIFLEQGIRFLTDYLKSNKYFKVTYPEQNLVRAKNQLHLAKEISLNLYKMEKTIINYTK